MQPQHDPIPAGHVRVYYINGFGAGYADPYDVPEGTTVQQFMQRHSPDVNTSQAAIRISKHSGQAGPAAAADVLENYDRLTALPAKGEGG